MRSATHLAGVNIFANYVSLILYRPISKMEKQNYRFRKKYLLKFDYNSVL